MRGLAHGAAVAYVLGRDSAIGGYMKPQSMRMHLAFGYDEVPGCARANNGSTAPT